MSHFYETKSFSALFTRIYLKDIDSVYFLYFCYYFHTKVVQKSQTVAQYVFIRFTNAFSQCQNNNKNILFKISEEKFGKSKLSEKSENE